MDNSVLIHLGKNRSALDKMQGHAPQRGDNPPNPKTEENGEVEGERAHTQLSPNCCGSKQIA
eukprot:871284-Amphidinium_carterae.1